MSPKPDPRTRLLADTIHADWSNGPAASFAIHAARSARRRRLLRHTIASASVAGVAVAAFLFSAQRTRSVVSPPSSAPLVAPAYEVISDAELLATLRDRPVLYLPGEPTNHRVVLLDE